MSVKLLFLSTNETLIGDIKEVSSDDKFVGYLITEPQSLVSKKEVVLTEDSSLNHSETEIKVAMTTWMPLSEDRQIFIYPGSVVSIMEPVPTIVQMYEDKVNGQSD
jgi:hypothetical protein